MHSHLSQLQGHIRVQLYTLERTTEAFCQLCTFIKNRKNHPDCDDLYVGHVTFTNLKKDPSDDLFAYFAARSGFQFCAYGGSLKSCKEETVQ